MSDGFLAFKGFAWGAAALFVGAALLPTATSGKFDPLRRLRAEDLIGKTTGRKTKVPTPTPTTSTPTPTTSTPTPIPTPTPTPTPTTSAAGYPELTTVASN